MYFSLKLFWQQVGPTCKTNYSFQNSIKRTKSSIVSELRMVLFRGFEYIYIYIYIYIFFLLLFIYHLHVITLITLLHGWCLEIIFFLVKQLRKKNSSIVYI